MNDTPVPLTTDDIELIADSIVYRQEHFDEEPLDVSVRVVLYNVGDRYTTVQCVNMEWSGTKAELTNMGGVPRCPNGHVMVETSQGKRLAWIDQEPLMSGVGTTK